MKFLVDTQLPSAVARWLTAIGIDALHVHDIGLSQADDGTIWQFALEHERIVISKDEDFFILATRPNDLGKLLWCRVGNCRKQELLRALELMWPKIEEAFQSGQQVVELR